MLADLSVRAAFALVLTMLIKGAAVILGLEMSWLLAALIAVALVLVGSAFLFFFLGETPD